MTHSTEELINNVKEGRQLVDRVISEQERLFEEMEELGEVIACISFLYDLSALDLACALIDYDEASTAYAVLSLIGLEHQIEDRLEESAVYLAEAVYIYAALSEILAALSQAYVSLIIKAALVEAMIDGFEDVLAEMAAEAVLAIEAEAEEKVEAIYDEAQAKINQVVSTAIGCDEEELEEEFDFEDDWPVDWDDDFLYDDWPEDWEDDDPDFDDDDPDFLAYFAV